MYTVTNTTSILSNISRNILKQIYNSLTYITNDIIFKASIYNIKISYVEMHIHHKKNMQTCVTQNYTFYTTLDYILNKYINKLIHKYALLSRRFKPTLSEHFQPTLCWQ